MNQSNYHLNEIPLEQLVEFALDQLKLLGYSKKSLYRYKTTWNHFIEYAHLNNRVDVYSDALAAQFIELNLVRDDKTVNQLKGWQAHMMFGMKVLGNFVRNKHIERPKTYIQNTRISPAMKKALRDFELYCKDKLYLRATSMELRLKEIIKFLEFLDARMIKRFKQIKPIDLSEFVSSKSYMKPKTVSRIVSDLRSFLKFIMLRGIVQTDLSHC